MSLCIKALVAIHVLAGVAGILLGTIVVLGMFGRSRREAWHGAFLIATAAASVTGFCFVPVYGMTSAQLVGIFSAAILSAGIYARYARRLAGTWNSIYIVSALAALFLNVLIAITQSFEHFNFMKDLAPGQTGAAFIILKCSVLILFIATGFFAVMGATNAA